MTHREPWRVSTKNGLDSMKAGSYVTHPAGGIHYDGARDEAVIVQIIGMGPVTTTQLSPEAPE